MTTPRPEALTAEEASFLRWCHERFQIVFRESPNLDWMRRLWRVSEAVDDAARAARPESGPCEECGWYPNIWPEDSAKRGDAAERHNAHVIARAARPETVVDVLDGVPHDHENGACTACLRDGYKRGVAARPETGLRAALEAVLKAGHIDANRAGERCQCFVHEGARAALATPPADAPLDVAWRAAEAALPEGWRLAVQRDDERFNAWHATAVSPAFFDGAEALLALAARLTDGDG